MSKTDTISLVCQYPNSLLRDNGYSNDGAALSLQTSYDKAVAEGANPRIMLINSPSNPTGQTFSASAILEITKFCREHNIALISDEIYSDLTFDERDQTTPCTKENFGTGPMILTGGMSKVISSALD